MLQISEVNRIAAEASQAWLPVGALIGVRSRPDVGPDGDEQIWVTLVVKDKVIDGIDGERALQTTDEVQHRLRAEGDSRLALVEFASETEVTANGGP